MGFLSNLLGAKNMEPAISREEFISRWVKKTITVGKRQLDPEVVEQLHRDYGERYDELLKHFKGNHNDTQERLIERGGAPKS